MNETSLKEALESFVNQKQIKNKAVEVRVVSFWPEMMGKLVDRYTEKIYLNRKTLFVEVGPAALKNELFNLKEDIIAKVNEKFGSETITDLVVK